MTEEIRLTIDRVGQPPHVLFVDIFSQLEELLLCEASELLARVRIRCEWQTQREEEIISTVSTS
jgi:hypothetical protein